MPFPGIKQLFKGTAEGAIKGITDGVGNIISKFKADPTKVAEYEKELRELEINSQLKLEELSNELEKIHVEALKAEEDNITARWQADMGSDDKLSKLARPSVLLYLIGITSLLIVVDSIPAINFDVKEAHMTLLEVLDTTVIVAYFGSRGFEKYQKYKTAKSK